MVIFLNKKKTNKKKQIKKKLKDMSLTYFVRLNLSNDNFWENISN
jgi:hypothetical protein